MPLGLSSYRGLNFGYGRDRSRFMTLAKRSPARPNSHPTWIVAVKKRAAMADRYVKHYCRHSQVAKLAKAEGWIGPLTKFVRESAWVQAQILCQVDPIGWDASLADHLGHFSTSDEAYAAFRQTIAGAIGRGRIEVRVPDDISPRVARIVLRPQATGRDWKDRPNRLTAS